MLYRYRKYLDEGGKGIENLENQVDVIIARTFRQLFMT